MKISKIRVGGLVLQGNLFLAPLAGYTDFVFRDMCYKYGASLAFTEMVSAKGMLYNNRQTEDLLREDGASIKAVQLFGNNPDILRAACESELLKNYRIVDLNFGCPVPKIYNNGEGSALMNDIPLAAKIVEECKKSGKIITVKFRTGITDERPNCVEFAKACEDAGADLITVHGRSKAKVYAGEVNYGLIASVKNAVNIPVIANGGVFCSADADALYERTGADGIMIARGAMFNPHIFAEIRGLSDDGFDLKTMILEQTKKMLYVYGERFTLVHMSKMTCFYIKGRRGATGYRERLFGSKSLDAFYSVVDDIFAG